MAQPDTLLESLQPAAFAAAKDAGTFDTQLFACGSCADCEEGFPADCAFMGPTEAHVADESWSDRRYQGELIEDCAAVTLGTQLRQIAVNAYFDACGDGKQEARERLMGYDRNAPSYYSNGGRS